MVHLLVVVHQSRHDTGIMRRLHELQEVIAQPMMIGGVEVSVTSSIGVAAFPADGETPEELIASAVVSRPIGQNRERPLAPRRSLRDLRREWEVALQIQMHYGLSMSMIRLSGRSVSGRVAASRARSIP